ncbi:MAG: hypothetical protein HY451_01005 [Parcubacteria group bacterium]|nr:hypothetical protein [Parcubacteria group bacterium]
MSKKSFKFISNILLSFLIILFITGGSVALAIDAPPGGPDGGAAGSLAWQKQVLAALADAAIKKLDAAENAVQVNLVLSAATKQVVLASLQGIEDQLVSYKAQIAQATTEAEIQKLNQQVGQYLQANKSAIINAFKAAFAEIGAAAAAKAKQFEATLRSALVLLKTLCPQQIATISAVENQLNELDADIAALSAAIQAKNVPAIIQKMNEIKTLIQNINANISAIQTACGISI